MNLTLLIISLSTGLSSLFSAYMLYRAVSDFNVRHLNYIILGMMLQGLLAISFIPQSFLFGTEYELLMTILAIVGAVFTLSGLTLITWNLRIHQKGNVPSRFLYLLIFFGIAISQIITGTSVMYTNNQWVIERTTIVRLVMFAATLWIMIELVIVFFDSLKTDVSKWSFVSVLYPVGMISSLFFLAFRENLPLPLTFYQIPAAIGIAGLALAIYKEPTVLIQVDTKISSVVLASRESGITNISYPDNPNLQSSAHLNTAAITGVSTLIQEISGKSELPPSLGYADYKIGIYPGDTRFIYTISNGNHPMMDGILSQMLTKWDQINVMEQGSVSSELIIEFKDDVVSKLGIFLPKPLVN